MTAIQEFIFSTLVNNAAVAAKIQRRAYYIKMPDNPIFPAITFQILSGNNEESFDGFSKLRNPIIGIDTWGEDPKLNYELAEAVRLAFHGYKGTFGTLVIQNILEWSENDLYEIDTQIFHMASSCRIWYYDNS